MKILQIHSSHRENGYSVSLLVEEKGQIHRVGYNPTNSTEVNDTFTFKTLPELFKFIEQYTD